MKVLLVKPGEYAVEAEIDNTLKSMQGIVGGNIEMFPLGVDEAVMVMNEEGKILGLDDNRALYDMHRNIEDIVAGTFFVCGVDGEEFTSLSPALMEKYMCLFYEPETMIVQDGKLRAVKENNPEMQAIRPHFGREHPGNLTFLIYQLKNNDVTRMLRFEPLEQIKSAGGSVEWGNYNHMYTGTIDPGMGSIYATLDKLFEKFNIARPADFEGHSLSVSDVVVLRRGGKTAAFYVDPAGFPDVPEFAAAPYHYYPTARPVDVGTFPKTESGPVHFVNYDKREPCENATFQAWGCLAYDAPLTAKQIADYELRPASDNPDREPVSPYQLEAQLQVIGKYEDSKRTNHSKRLTWLHNDLGVYIRHENATPARVAERFGEIMETKARSAGRQTVNMEQAARETTAKTTTSPPEKPSVLGQIRDMANRPATPKSGRPAQKKPGPER